ncbi:MAG: ROK family protein [Hamadaea sp.]|uniref:ROK family transcriptional regulator n=1 Tax=Hamadaea sp. TaxID=2024425 RepID=UPI0017BCD049|nr:ROK family protein [Hamadaea sp.]NUR73445.1 ROK family protein [Hamadaea sp.]NUT23805.1 ROK family protein [Hamadaea sp.]
MPVTGPGHLLALIRTRPHWTRRELLDATGMSRPTLLERLAPLFAAGLIHEAGSTRSEGGRPPQLIRFDDRSMVVLTFDVGHTHARVCYSGVDGRPLRFVSLRVDPADPGTIVTELLGVAAELGPAIGERLIGVGVGLPAPISPLTGLPSPSTVLPSFPAARMQRLWEVPVVFENDARAFALGAALSLAGGVVLGVKWSSGIGAGVVVDGRCLTGADGAAGDIGHILVDPDGPLCRCGRRGCLAAFAAGYALQGASPVAAARRVGGVLASLIALVNPRTLVLGGSIGAQPSVVSIVDEVVRSVAMPHSVGELRVVASPPEVEAATVGLVELVVRRVLSPDAVDALAAP